MSRLILHEKKNSILPLSLLLYYLKFNYVIPFSLPNNNNNLKIQQRSKQQQQQ